jgi:hypothetical protein
MAWIIVCTLLAYLLVNTPLLYAVLYVYGPKRIIAMWGYSPHQFLFLTVIFPFVAYCAFAATYVLFSRVGPSLPAAFSGRWFFDNGVAIGLLGLAAICLCTTADYASSARSLDKLRPQYADRAIRTINSLKDQIDNTPADEREAKRDLMERQAKRDFSLLNLPEERDSGAIDHWMARLSPGVYLLVVQDATYQRRLGLVDPVLYVLSNIQVVVSLFVALFILISVFGLGIVHSSHELDQRFLSGLDFQHLTNLVYAGIFFLAFYPILFHQYRAELEPYVGSAGSSLQDIISIGIIVALLAAVTWLTSAKKEVSDLVFSRVLPILAIVGGFSVEVRTPQILRELIGVDTTIGRIVPCVVIFILVSAWTAYLLWPRR